VIRPVILLRMKIALASLLPTTDLPLVAFLHRRLALPLAHVRGQLALGSSGTFYTCELYGNDHVQRDSEIRDIVRVFAERNAPLQVWEMDAGQSPEPLEEAHLLNALDAAAGGYR